MQIPMVDLKGQYETLRQEIEAGFRTVLETTHFILGPQGKALEEEVAAYCGVRHAIGVASGTDALHLALRAAGIGEGDEVITTPFTFIATAEAISYVGGRPVFVDIDPLTFNIDVELIEAAITDRTRAILPVHLFGQPADLAPIRELCRKHGLRLIEDCAQSFGAEYGDRRSGAYGELGCFSFFPSKNLGCYGDGGMIVTDDDRLAEEVRVYRNHGSRERYHHSVIGYNSRLDELQAVVLRAKLKHLDGYNEQRRRNAHRYTARLQGTKVTPPAEDGKGLHVYHQYTVLSDARDAIHQALTAAGIASAVYYPIPLHRQEVYRELYAGVSMPVAESVAKRVLSLPMFPELTEAQIDRVCDVILGAL
ncbi:UDP-2-acetamido-2-deoxy-alpha-D-ribo-hexopyranos- 3-ulose 3-aminotransferase [Desulfuromonas versatilis]|uniref:UDP-2-acetamido-2-deoxy-alpha-D-ribo-hexopyranos- 3-ulose 3-aminotransferase n=1 Tax=Desulfuromonas versatilis TaxID=2802975 RepID=A0ABN6DYR9_9BACT|nr:DegT/DnrJ/EryC1/StrS family aminotransferase [Desulfuromonas versatilis]BCR05205.1 UDP-2-acetamido-2-deoxy-alpha-D-ribo-hexopyranos- 3-ulose 3-aminotransferase [Desulfuromonas versatilis]